jgi:hypothetical protein
MAIFWDVATLVWYKLTDVSEPTADFKKPIHVISTGMHNFNRIYGAFYLSVNKTERRQTTNEVTTKRRLTFSCP